MELSRLRSGKFLLNLLKFRRRICGYANRPSKNSMVANYQISVSGALEVLSYTTRNGIINMPFAISYVFVGLDDVRRYCANKKLKRNHDFVKTMCGVR